MIKSILTKKQKIRFINNLFITDSCWLWDGYRRKGYGRFYFNGKYHSAHRVSYELFIGLILPPLKVLHVCDTPACVYPKHLFLGTQFDNIRDAVSKNRMSRSHQPKGALCSWAKLTETQVSEIRDKYSLGFYTQYELADEYRIDQSTISYIVNRKLWKSLS